MKKVVQLTKEFKFSATHQLQSGECRTRHGHLYGIRITVQAPVDANSGLLIDRSYFDQIVQEQVLSPLHGRFLNEILPIPTGEMICAEIKSRLNPFFSPHTSIQVSLQETRKNWFSTL